MKRLATPLHVSPVTASNATTKGKASVYLSVGIFFFFLRKIHLGVEVAGL